VPKYQAAMAAGIKQLKPFTTAGGTTVTASATELTNYTVVTAVNMQGVTTYTNTAKPDTFNIANIKNFKRFTNDTAAVLGYTPDGAAFHATNCFDEIDGLLHDVDLPYALFVPADYDAEQEIHARGARGRRRRPRHRPDHHAHRVQGQRQLCFGRGPAAGQGPGLRRPDRRRAAGGGARCAAPATTTP
jgi:hypothetical protein